MLLRLITILGVLICTASSCPQNCNCIGTDVCQHCIPGKYGPQCDKECPSGCKYGICDQSSGHCKQCTDGLYDDTCTLSCSSNCKDRLCDKDSGACKNCVPSYYGPQCNQTCPENCIDCSSAQPCTACKTGHYGATCTEDCPANCKRGMCNKVSGICREGCVYRYYGARCDNGCPTHCVTCRDNAYCYECEIGFKGYTCQYRCGHCKPGTGCKQTTGQCYGGCSDGYYGHYCNSKCSSQCKTCKTWEFACEVCTDGKYGKDTRSGNYQCDKDCPTNCLKKACDRDTGNCLACVGGYTGDRCDCPEHCQACSSPGVCTSCKDGYTNIDKQCTCTKDACATDTCESCINSKWYTDINVRTCCECSRNCKNRECSSENRCTNGCVAGYYGEGCGKKCSSQDKNCIECKSVGDQYGSCIVCAKGFYPGGVNNTCINNCSTGYYGEGCGRRCAYQDQNCSECQSIGDRYIGCIKCMNGFYPDDVNNTCVSCPDRCIDALCSPADGHCINECVDKFWGERCDKDCPNNCLKCDRYSGDCLNCSEGKYSIDCSGNCSNACKMTKGQLLCSITDGSCLHGCNSDVVYGPQCKHRCNYGCIQNRCERKTGHCLLGCEDNFYGDSCNATCSDGCIEVGSGRTCLANNGSCIAGCTRGLFGERCDAKCSKYCLNDTCSRYEGVCVFGCVMGYDGDTCSNYMASSDNQPNTSITWSMVGAVIGGALVLILVGGIIIFVLVKRRRSVREEQAASTPLQMVSHPGPGDNMTTKYESVTTYDVVEERREGENEYNTVTPEPGTNRTVTPVYENQNKRDVKPDVHLEPIGSCPDENNTPDYDTATTYEALGDRPGTENVYKTVMPDTHQTATTYEALGDRADPENDYNTVVTDTNPSEGQYGNI